MKPTSLFSQSFRCIIKLKTVFVSQIDIIVNLVCLKTAQIWNGSRDAVYPCLCLSTIFNINISAIKFYMKHHWGGGKAAQVLGQIGSALVSMATDISQ